MTLSINPLDHFDAEVTRSYFCQLAGHSKIGAYRHERIDPLWPKPVTWRPRALQSTRPSDVGVIARSDGVEAFARCPYSS